MTELISGFDFGWLVGFFEGEGSISTYKVTGPRAGHAIGIRLTVVQKDRSLLERFQLLAGGGGGISWHNREHTCSRYVVSGKSAMELANRMLPHLSARRQGQVLKAFETYSNRPKQWGGRPANFGFWTKNINERPRDSKGRILPLSSLPELPEEEMG